MQKKVYFSCFILCTILSQRIFAQFLEEGVGESYELLARQKRVIDRRPGGDRPLSNGQVPYVVNLKRNGRSHCIASILSHYTAITAARCVDSPDITIYTVLSGTAFSYRGNEHNVTEKRTHGHSPSRSSLFLTGIGLITVNPLFQYTTNTSSISLHSGPVLAGMEGVISGWANRVGRRPVESEFIRRLRFIIVPIMNHRECQNLYHGYFPITEEDVCTYDPQKACGNTDAGAPLVIGNELVGVHIGQILTMHEDDIRPDVFVLLQHSNYAPWIIRNIVH